MQDVKRDIFQSLSHCFTMLKALKSNATQFQRYPTKGINTIYSNLRYLQTRYKLYHV